MFVINRSPFKFKTKLSINEFLSFEITIPTSFGSISESFRSTLDILVGSRHVKRILLFPVSNLAVPKSSIVMKSSIIDLGTSAGR